jgi:hypothetical protein
MKTQHVESLVVESTFATSLFSSQVSFFSSSSVMMINPWRWSGRSCRAVRLDGRLLHTSLRFSEPHRRALCGPHPTEEKSRRRVSFLLGGAVSSSILRGDSETECLFEEVIDKGLDDDDPFFLVKKACSFLPWLQHSLPHK